MVIDTSGPFSVSHSTTSGYFKPVNSAGSKGAAQVGLPSVGTDDSVSMSKLGQALSGRAADLFKHLDSKARGTLEGYVNSGKMTADEVVKGLKAMATYATFNRYLKEAPRDQEDLSNTQEAENISKFIVAKGTDSAELAGQRRNARAALDKNEISADEYMKKTGDIESARRALVDSLKPPGADNVGERLAAISTAFLNKKGKEFSAAGLGTNEAQGAPLATNDELAAMKKLGEMGFDKSVFGKAFESYAADVDLPGVGQATVAAPTPASREPVAQTAAPAPQTAAEPAAPTKAPAAPQAAAPAANADPSNSAAALSLLQSALNAGTKAGTTGLFGNAAGNGASASGGMAESLLESLKAGAGKAKADDAQGV